MIAFSVALAVSAIVPFVAVPEAYRRVRRWSLAGAAGLVAVPRSSRCWCRSIQPIGRNA